MRFGVKILLFISAYTPLFLIFILRYTKYHEIYFWIGVGALILINLIWIPIFRLTRGWTKSTFTIKKSINRTSDALNYIIAYIIAFLGFRFELWQDWVSLFILLAVIFFVYVHSNLIFVNPLLNICGYKIYDIEVVESGSIVLITKRNRLRENEKITVKNMSDNIYQEVI